MMRMRKLQTIVVATMFGLGIAGSVVHAQQQVNADGHALDANNQIGSGGSNNSGAVGQQQPINTQVPINSVSGGGVNTNSAAGRGVLTNTRENENTRENFNSINNSTAASGVAGTTAAASHFYSPPNALVPGSAARSNPRRG